MNILEKEIDWRSTSGTCGTISNNLKYVIRIPEKSENEAKKKIFEEGIAQTSHIS